MSADERLARELQQQEMQQHQQQQMWNSAGGAPVAQMGVPPGSATPGGPVPMVQGTVVGGAPVGMPGGAPVVIGAPTGVVVADLPYAIAVEEIPLHEAIVLRYRFAMMCFSMIDATSTILNVARSIGAFGTFGKMDDDSQEDLSDSSGSSSSESIIEKIGLRSFGLLGLVFLIGPLCGLVGARRLNRGLVTVYLVFCLGKTAFQIFLAIIDLSPWYILIALVQMWVTKIVFTFWRALGKITPERCAALVNPNLALQRGDMRMAYW